MQDRDPPAPPSSNEVAGEDFLFHLYRGSELLQDNRVHDAKAELEQALRFQPSDPKGQDLLGIVYFRLGLYPRAIAIYERLVQSHPDAIEPRVNLALSYLKTGQAAAARFELERVVEQNPHHSRAWGYLGLAFQRLGDYERASHAFAAGGHDVMARRLLDMAIHTTPTTSVAAPASLVPEAADPRESRRPPPMAPKAPSSGWTAIEQEVGESPSPPPASVASVSEVTPEVKATSQGPIMPPPARLPSNTSAQALPEAPASVRLPKAAPPAPLVEMLRATLVVYPRAMPISRHPSGVVLVQAAGGFAIRFDVVQSISLTGSVGDPLRRRVRGRVSDELLGGERTPLFDVPGKSELLLSPAKDLELLPISLDEEPFYLREDIVAGFEPHVSYENGRLPVGDGDAIPMVQLRGPGTVIAHLPEKRRAIEVQEGRAVTVRARVVLGWSGRLLPRALLPSEAPAETHGLVTFSGGGMVLLDGRN